MVGKLVASQGAQQVVKMQVTNAKLLDAAYGGENGEIGGMRYPLSKKKHSMEHMRQHAHLRCRGRLHSAVMRCRHAITVATHNFFHEKGFVHCDTPIITATNFEGLDGQFKVSSTTEGDGENTNQKRFVHGSRGVFWEPGQPGILRPIPH